MKVTLDRPDPLEDLVTITMPRSSAEGLRTLFNWAPTTEAFNAVVAGDTMADSDHSPGMQIYYALSNAGVKSRYYNNGREKMQDAIKPWLSPS